MSSEQFIPSSPILSSVHDDKENDNPQLPQKRHLELTPIKKKQIEYPTPNPSSDFPSSSAGFTATSPTRNANVATSPMRQVNVETSPLQIELVRSSSPMVQPNDHQYKFISPMDNVKIFQMDKVGYEWKFGRSSKISEIQLNKKNKSISKLHFTLELTNKNIIIKCIGINGMNLTIPRPCIVKFTGTKDQYLIEPQDDKSNLNKNGVSAIKRCNQNYENLTNILLLNGEIVILPRMKGILLDIWDDFILLETSTSKHDSNEVVVSKQGSSDQRVAMIYKPHEDKEFKKPDQRSRSRTPTQRKKLKQESVELYKDISDDEVNEKLSQIDQLPIIENLLINHLAFSRLASTPISILQKISTTTMLLDKLDLQLILVKKIDCVGVIYREGKDAAGKPLEEEYYYQLDLDNDLERQKLVNDLKGAGGNLRSCRKVHKQYFWKKPKV